jgi:hypothetical protein
MLLDVHLKHEVGWETIDIALDLLVQALRGNTIEIGQISIQHDLLATNQKYAGYHML